MDVDRHENYPTTDMLLTAIGMDEIYNDVTKRSMLCNLKIYLWALEGKGWDNMNSENFLAKYKLRCNKDIFLYIMIEQILTCFDTIIRLRQYEGGGTWFRRQEVSKMSNWLRNITLVI